MKVLRDICSEDSDLNIYISFPCAHALQLGLIPNSVIFMQTAENIWKTTSFYYDLLIDLKNWSF